MSEVFVLIGGYDYEGEFVLGVYASEDAARVAQANISADDFYDEVRIEKMPIQGG